MLLGPAGTLSAGERSYPTTKVRGSSLECQAAAVQERPRGATPHPRSGVVAGRRHPMFKVRGSREKPLLTQGQVW